MGGEWSLGVALVMEIWPDRSRAFLAGLIGAAANVGYLLVAVLGLGLDRVLNEVGDLLRAVGLSEDSAVFLTSHSGWRILLILGAAPALLTFFIQLLVPESERWQQERGQGRTSNWAVRDLAGVCLGGGGGLAVVYLWAEDFALSFRVAGSLLALVVITAGYTYPVIRYLQRGAGSRAARDWLPTVRRMLLGACLGGVALLGTWASIQWASVWADKLTGGRMPQARAYTQFWSAFGAVLGTILGALMGNWFGRRIAYTLLCVGSLASALFFFQMNDHYGAMFLASVFIAGGLTAAFYGWLPLYLPELFRTSVRATGQGFSFNFGRILAAVGALQTGYLTKEVFKEDYAQACSVMSLIYLVGIGIIWLAPETRGRPLPD
jgi:MFS family permease